MRAISTEAFLLLVDKPAGVTSHDVVAIVRRALGTPKAGHTGTLDPFATGLLVILGGRGTRVIPYVSGEPKEYVATIRFGIQTDTDDSTGETVRTAPPPGVQAITDALPALTGDIEQVPPSYSAKHVGGRRAYALARKGHDPALPASRVRVHRWDVLHRTNDTLQVRIVCAGGTYIRALARDLGLLTQSAAHLSALQRTRSGSFSLDEASSLDDIRAGMARLRPLRDALGDMAVQVVGDDDARLLSHGMRIEAALDAERAAMIDGEGALLAIASRDGDAWHPDIVIAHA
jgi:tRNA pseudouridine55 synthase